MSIPELCLAIVALAIVADVAFIVLLLATWPRKRRRARPLTSGEIGQGMLWVNECISRRAQETCGPPWAEQMQMMPQSELSPLGKAALKAAEPENARAADFFGVRQQLPTPTDVADRFLRYLHEGAQSHDFLTGVGKGLPRQQPPYVPPTQLQMDVIHDLVERELVERQRLDALDLDKETPHADDV